MEGTLGGPVFPERPAPPPPEPRSAASTGQLIALGVAALLLLSILLGNPLTSALWNALGDGGRGSYEFIRTDPDHGGDPVTWDHCLAIRYQVNPEGAPEDWREIVTAAFDDISDKSGFVFVDAGETRNRVISGEYRPGATRGEPVLIIWSSQGRMHSLQGGTIGLGGGASVSVNGRLRLVTGSIILDSDTHNSAVDPMSSLEQQLVLEHEIGHVLGLDHVDDDRQLMAPAYAGQDSLGPGDIAGLEALHAVPCG
jgi:hypothetical protein